MSAARYSFIVAIALWSAGWAFGGEPGCGVITKQPPEGLLHMSADSAIPWGALGTATGSALAVSNAGDGPLLRCDFQRMQGLATVEGLWLASTTTNSDCDGLRLVATAVGRKAERQIDLSTTGLVRVVDSLVSWERPGLTEEYSVSVEGVRQDFVIAQAPAGKGVLCVELALTGARAHATAYGAKLVLDGSCRELAYSRLHAADAKGKELSAKIEVFSPTRLAVCVDDAGTAYPVRIDPTFSDANWVSLGGLPGVDGQINSIIVDTNRGLVYVGGNFDAAGSVTASNIAEWNGTSWLALGSGISGGGVSTLALDSRGNLYVGGNFTHAGGIAATNIAVWNGAGWNAVVSMVPGGAFGPGVTKLAVDQHDNLYVGGNFITIGGVAANYIAQWNGSAWSALGSGLSLDASDDLPVGAFAFDEMGNLYVGGSFTTAGDVLSLNIAKWNGSAWSPLGAGVGRAGSQVSALAFDGAGNLYAGGLFDTAGGTAATNIAKWNGITWSAVGSGMNLFTYAVYALALDSSGNLYAGGIESIAKWSAGVWTTVGSGLTTGVPNSNTSASALAFDGLGNLYVGGSFTMAGGVAAANMAKWNGGTWSALGSGFGGRASGVYALAVGDTGSLYVGGSFAAAGNVSANSIAQWDGSTWSALGSGINDTVRALVVDRAGNLYAGGNFTNAGGIAATNIAKWDGHAWSALGAGLGVSGGQFIPVRALAVDGSGNLYAGGQFATAGGQATTNIAKWNGITWSALSSGMGPADGFVLALAVDASGNLYAGGNFTNAGGIAATNIAKWDGSTWSSLGAGWGPASSAVLALAVDPAGNLLAGGDFNPAVGTLAKWNGSVWSVLGSYLYFYSPVFAITLDSTGNIYAGGQFTQAGGGVPANNVAKWDGTSWSALGAGVGGGSAYPYMAALAVDRAGHLYAGGEFALAGGAVSPYVAQANILTLLSKPFLNTNGDMTFSLLTQPNASSRVLAATNLVPPVIWQSIYTNVAPANGAWQFTDTNTRLYPLRFYRSSTP
jgi:hypothetical protein